MSDTVPTVKVKSGDSYAIINESDFDPAVHEKFNEPAPLPPPPGSDLPPPPPPVKNPLDDLAADWKSGSAAELKKLAEVVSGRAVDNKQQAIDVIEAALAARPAE